MFKPEVKPSNSIAATAFLTSLIRMQHTLYRKETANFVVAREAALNITMPRRYDLYQFYRDIETDLFIKGQVDQRINRIKNRSIKVVNKSDGTPNEELTKLLKNKKFVREFIGYVMEAKFWGFSLIYLNVDTKGRIVTNSVWREHLRPENNLVLRNPFDTEGADYTQPPLRDFVIAVGNPESLGIYEQLAIPYILRKHSWASWDEFEELFGVPLRWINTNSTDKKVLDALESFAIEMGSSNYAIVPGGATMEIKEGRTQDAFQVFNEKRKAANEEISIRINGHAEQVNEKGSRGKSETIIGATQDEITLDDKLDVMTVMNEELLPLLAKLFAMPFTDDVEMQWDDTARLDPQKQAAVYKAVSDMGFELDQDEVSEVLSIKIAGRKQVKTQPPKGKQGKQDKEPSAYKAYVKMHADLFELYNNIH